MARDERSITEANREAGMGSEDIRDKVCLGGKMMLRQGNQGNLEMRLEKACMLRIYGVKRWPSGGRATENILSLLQVEWINIT